MDLLRFVTAGSVDDGKSTLIGRLLLDTKQIFEDTLASMERASATSGDDELNLALLTDGLRAEREQGITIDVAYRYFATPRRKFIIADSPGHVQYTRNMVTGASTADLALVLVDAREGVVQQTRRHSAIASLLGISHLVMCVNKMDLVGWSQTRFREIEAQFVALADTLGVRHTTTIPMSALRGDNVVTPSDAMPWYEGSTLLGFLEEVEVSGTGDRRAGALRFPVQYVLRPQSGAHPDYRGYAGTIAAGEAVPGAAVTVLPGGDRTRIASIDALGRPAARAAAGDAVVIRLQDDVDVSRGYMIVSAERPPSITSTFSADVCWLSGGTALEPTRQYSLKHTTRRVRCLIESIDDQLDIGRLERVIAPEALALNEIGRITVRTTEPLFVEAYRDNRETGSFILIDPTTYLTVAAGMVRHVPDDGPVERGGQPL